MIQYYYGSFEVYSNYSPRSSVGKRRMEIYRDIFKNLSKYIGERVLDLACGGGIASLVLAEMGKSVVGIDIQEEMIEIAKKSVKDLKGVEFVVGDVREVNLGKCFDTIMFLGNSIVHFSMDDFRRTIKNAKKHLKTEGFFIIEYADGIWDLLNETSKPSERVKRSYNQYEGSIDLTIIEKKIRDDLFEGVRLRFYLWTPWTINVLLKYEGFKLEERIYLGNNTFMDVYKLERGMEEC